MRNPSSPFKALSTLLISIPLFAQSLSGEPTSSQSFQQIVTEIRQDGKKENFDRQAAAQQLQQVATVEQLSSFLGEDSIVLQVCAVRALGLKKEKALLIYLGAHNSEVRAEASKFVLGPPPIPEGLPYLAKSLTFRDQPETLTERAITANILLGTPACANNLIRFAAQEDALLPLREKALAELLKFPELTSENKKQIVLRLNPAVGLASTQHPLSATWLSHALTLCKQCDTSITVRNLLKVLTDLTQTQAIRIVALDAMIESGSTANELLNGPETNGLRVPFLNRWYQENPTEALAFCKDALGADRELGDFLDRQSISRAQEVLQFLTALATPAADALLSESIISLITKNRLEKALWLEVEEALTARGNSIHPRAHRLFKKLCTTKNGNLFPEDSYRALFYGGDRVRGREIAFSKKGRCTECHTINDSIVPFYFSAEASGASRWENLRSLIAPNYDIDPGRAWVAFELKDGSTLSGIESYPTETQYFYFKEIGEPQAIDKDDVSSVTRTSLMPSALDYLTQREIRDLVEYLSNAY